MAEDWAADVKRYDASADDDVIAGIVRYCGIALRKRDSSLVSFSDAKETARVRENFLKKKLALTQADSELDSAIAAVGERMKGDNTKNRVTVYYLLTDRFGAHQLFRKKAAAKATSAPAARPAAATPAAATPAAATPAAATPAAATPAPKRAKAPAAAKPARTATASAKPVTRATPVTPPPPAAPPVAPSTPVGLASPLPPASSGDGEKLGFGRYRAGQHGGVGAGWLGGAVVVAAGLLALGLLGGR